MLQNCTGRNTAARWIGRGTGIGSIAPHRRQEGNADCGAQCNTDSRFSPASMRMGMTFSAGGRGQTA
jgi:hypothetical protein